MENRASHAMQEDGVTKRLVQGIGKFPPSSSQRVTESDMLGVLAQSGVAEAAGFGAVTDFDHVYPAAGLKACQNGRVRHIMGTGVKQTHVLYYKVGPSVGHYFLPYFLLY